MRILDWREKHTSVCVTEYLPALLNNFASKLNTTIEYWEWKPLTSRQGTRGFHFTNIINVVFKLAGYDDVLSVKLPIPNDSDLFMINDTYRILTMELLDSVVSVRNLGDMLAIRWQFLISALSSDDKGRIRVGNVKVPMWQLFYHSMTEDELRSKNLWFVLSKEPIKNFYPIELIKVDKVYKLYVPMPREKWHPFQRTLINSVLYNMSTKPTMSFTLPEKVEQIVNDMIDPVTTTIYKVKDLKSLCLFTISTLLSKRKEDLVGASLDFKRVRSLEVILGTFYRKLIETYRQQKRQTRIRLSNDYLLKCMFTDPNLQRLFEYIEMGNVFKEMGLKHKVSIPIEFMPFDLRDVHMSFKERVDIYDTPDDSNISKVNYLALDCELDEYGRFM